MAATGAATGVFFVLTGVLPWEYVVELIAAPPYWLTNGFTKITLVIVGVAIVIGSLHWNVWSHRQKVVDELAELSSKAIHNLLNRTISNDHDLARLTADINQWCQE